MSFLTLMKEVIRKAGNYALAGVLVFCTFWLFKHYGQTVHSGNGTVSSPNVPTPTPQRSWSGRETTVLYDSTIRCDYPIPVGSGAISFSTESVTSGTVEIRLPESHRRPDSTLEFDGQQLRHISRWYGLSFAPGIEIAYPEALGLDLRFFYIKDFSAQVGAAYFYKEKEIQPSIGVAYNLRLVRYLKNTDLFVSYTPKTVIGGIRLELGD